MNCDADYDSLGKLENVYRLALVGDSVTLGYGVHYEQSFVNMFSTYVKNSHSPRNIQAMNFGVDGYNTIQIYELLATKVLPFEPDKVVYVMCLNDFDFEHSSGGKIRYFKKPDYFMLEKFELVYRHLLIDFNSWHYGKNKESVFHKIMDMRRLLQENGIPSK